MALIGNVSGSLTKTVDGRGYLRPGANITITSGAFDGDNNQHYITIAASSGGSLTGIDDQSSSNDDQLTIKDGEIVINEDSDDLDFRIETNESDRAFFVDGGNDAITFFATAAERPGNSQFFVSGAASAGGDTTPQNDHGAHVGGDLIVTGNLYNAGTMYGAGAIFATTTVQATTNLQVGGDIVHVGDTDTKISFGTDTLTTTVGNVEFIKITEDDSQDMVEYNSATADVDFIFDNANAEVLSITAGGLVINEGGHATNDFRVESNNEDHAIFVDAGGDYVAINATAAQRPGNAGLFVSGSASATSATSPQHDDGSHFGGDVVVSGSIFTAGTINATTGIGTAGNMTVGGAIFHDGDTDTKMAFDTDKITFTVGNVEHLTIVEAGDDEVVVNEGSNEVSFRVETNANDHAVYVDASDEKISLGSNSDQFASDTWLFVSGNTNLGDRHNAKGAVTVFGGGVVLSGSMVPGVDNSIDLGSSNNRFANIYTADLNLRNDRGNWTLIEEENFISFRDNNTGKRFKMVMEEITGDGSYGPGNDGEM